MGWASGMAAGVRLGEAVNANRARRKEGLVAEEISAFDATQAEQAAAYKKQQENAQNTSNVQAAFNNGGVGAGPDQNMSAVPQAPNTLAGMGLAPAQAGTAPQQSAMPAPARVEAPMSVLDQLRARESIYRGAGLTDQADKLASQALDQQRYDIGQEQFATTTGLARDQLAIDTRAANTADQRSQFELGQARIQTDRDAKQQEGVSLLQSKLSSGEATPENIGALYSEYGIDPAVGNEYVTGFYNISEQATARKQEQLALQTAELNLDGLVDLHKKDDSITPGRHFDYAQVGGKLILSEFDTETGEKVRDLAEFSSTAELETNLRSLASGYGAAIESLANTAKEQRSAAADAAIEYAKVSADLTAVEGGIREKLIDNLGKLQAEPMFRGMEPSQQEAAIAEIYKAGGVVYSGTMIPAGDYGAGAGAGTTPPPADSADAVRQGLKRQAGVDAKTTAKNQALVEEAEALIAEFTPEQLDSITVSDDLKAAVEEAYAAKRIVDQAAYLESLTPAQRVYESNPAFRMQGLNNF